jgi:hypothetical protein
MKPVLAQAAVTGAVAVVGLALFPPAATGQPNFFTAPDGNIGCDIYDFQARCDINDHTFSPPAKPTDCPLNWGDEVVVRTDQQGQFNCHIDSAFGDGPVLALGATISAGPMSCTSTPSGIGCRNSKTQHGFDISRQAYRLY